MCLPKKKTNEDLDLLNIAETLHDFSSTAANGKHLWLGLIFKNMIHHFQERGLDFTLQDSKSTSTANKWKRKIFQVIKPLLEAANEMWKLKKSSSRETLLGGSVPDARRQRDLTNRRRGDIHMAQTDRAQGWCAETLDRDEY